MDTIKRQEKTLGELLLEAKLITETQLKEALEEQKITSEPLGKILIKKKYIDNKDIANVLKGILVVIFEINSELFAIEVIYTREILKYQKITPVPSSPKFITGIISLREKIVPVVSLNEKLFNKKDKLSEDTRIIVVEKGIDFVGVLVDKVLSVKNYNIENFENINKYNFNIDKKFLEGLIKDEDRIITLIKPEILF